MIKAQKMKAMKELAESVSVRNHVYMLVNSSNLVSKTDRRALMSFVNNVDKHIVETTLEMIAPKEEVVKVEVLETAEVKASKEVVVKKNKSVAKPVKDKATRKGVVKRVLES